MQIKSQQKIDDKIAFTICPTTIVLISVVYIFYSVKTYKLRKWNPIQELSPLLTLVQAFSLYLFILIALIILMINNNNKQESTSIVILMIVQNFSRGLFIVLSIMKSIRITLAFWNKLKRYKWIINYFQDQTKILISSLIMVMLFWTGEYYIYFYYKNKFVQQSKQRVIVSYEEVNYVSAINNLLEVLSSLIIIYYNNKLNTIQFQALKDYITTPLIVYSIWLYINTFLNLTIHQEQNQIEDSLPLTFLIMWISQMGRCCTEFYLIIIKPIQTAVYQRSPFTPSILLQNFEHFIRIPFCNMAFYRYVCDQSLKGLICTKSNLVNPSISQDFLNSKQVFENWLEATIQIENQWTQQIVDKPQLKVQETIFNQYDQEDIRIKLLNYLVLVYREYQTTYSFHQIQNLFNSFDMGNENFYRLKIIETFIE